MATSLYWFKNDLRLHDNETLSQAIHSGAPLLPVYIFDVQVYRQHHLGFPKADQVRLEFARQSVVDLQKNLRKQGGDLLIAVGRPEEIIPQLVTDYSCLRIFMEREFADEECKQVAEIKKDITHKCTIHSVWGRTLYHIDDIPYSIDKIPLTSKAYRINTTKNSSVREPLPSPARIECISFHQPKWEDDLSKLFLHSKNYDKTFVKGGETEALKRLDYYLFESEQLTRYRWTRNRSHGMDYSTKFSPYLALGCLSPRKIYEEVKRYEQEVKKNQSTWWVIFEMVWRDYFTFKLMRFQNAVYQTEGYTNKEVVFTNNEELFERWCQGETGIPFVDAHMRQLNATGYMSNRGRVNCSSFLVHDYKIDWTWGAAYFESKLIDYDVAANWMNWHTQAYQIWYTNPVNQANKYKAQEYLRHWLPEIAHLSDGEILIPWESEVKNYPKPVEIFPKWLRAINKIKRDHG